MRFWISLLSSQWHMCPDLDAGEEPCIRSKPARRIYSRWYMDSPRPSCIYGRAHSLSTNRLHRGTREQNAPPRRSCGSWQEPPSGSLALLLYRWRSIPYPDEPADAIPDQAYSRPQSANISFILASDSSSDTVAGRYFSSISASFIAR